MSLYLAFCSSLFGSFQKTGVTSYTPQNTLIPTIGAPKKGSLVHRNCFYVCPLGLGLKPRPAQEVLYRCEQHNTRQDLLGICF